MSYQVLMPVFAKNILQGNASTLGFLMAAAGIGALLSSIKLVSRKNVAGIERFIVLGSALFGFGLIAFSFSRHLGLSLVTLLIVGFGMMTVMTSCNTMLQTVVAEDKRGRVMSFYAMAFQGMTPFGNLLAGSLANHIGAPRAVMVGGACCVCASVFFAAHLGAIRKALRA